MKTIIAVQSKFQMQRERVREKKLGSLNSSKFKKRKKIFKRPKAAELLLSCKCCSKTKVYSEGLGLVLQGWWVL